MTKSMIALFKGFVPTRDKKCIMPFKGKSTNELLTYDQVKDLDEFAGILADDVVLVDFDDPTQAEIFMTMVEDFQLNCAVNTTTRGKHGFFKNSNGLIQKCFTHTKLGCGLVADIKVGNKNSYAILKFNGKERFTEWDVEDGHEYDELPKWMVPVRGSTEFLTMDAGSGRNQSLFNYILALQSADFSVDEARETIRIINKYILKDPLDESELDVILRDEAFQKPVFFKGTQFQHDKFGNYLKSAFHIKRINGSLHVYSDGVYLSGNNRIESAMIQVLPAIKTAQRTEVMKYLECTILDNWSADPFVNMIPLRNGVYDLKQCKLLPFSPDLIVTNKIPWDWNPNAYSALADRVLNDIACNDIQIRMLLEEIAGYCLYRKDTLEKSFILTGAGANGKSTFLTMLQKMLGGTDNVCFLDIAELSDRFSTVMLVGMLANIGDDISEDFLQGKQLSLFKKIVTGNAMKAERKGYDAFSFRPYCKLLFSANSIPRMHSKGFAALKRRLLIVPFNAKFTSDSDDFDPYIEDKLTTSEVMEYMILLGVNGLQRALKNRRFTECDRVQKEVEQFEKENDPVSGWVDSLDDEKHMLTEDVSTLYQEFAIYCGLNGFAVPALMTFSKCIQERFGFKSYRKTINGKKYTMLR